MAGLSSALFLSVTTNAFGQRGRTRDDKAGFPIPKDVEHDPLNALTMEMFAKNKYSKFYIHVNDSTVVEMELIEITEGPSEQSDLLEGFMLGFHTHGEKTVGQGTYKIKHGKLGEFEMFLVPSYWDMYGVDYVAVFNRLRPSGK